MSNVVKERSDEENGVCDYMLTDYDLIAEPLNLRQAGRAWFESVYRNCVQASGEQPALLLGSVDWMANMLARRHSRVIVVDGSEGMIEKAKAGVRGSGPGIIDFVAADWRELPDLPPGIDAVLGDNSFNFLPFPSTWELVCDRLADALCAGGVLLFRFFCVPDSHVRRTPQEIVRKYRGRETVNYTEVRADILFSQWDPHTYCIDTEAALACYEENLPVFESLLAGKPHGFRNDLQSIVKYRNTGSAYHAPPLGRILNVLEERFHVTQVSFGPYGLSQYFPLIAATRR